MALANLRTRINYGGSSVGLNGGVLGNVFIDSSQKPMAIERAGGKFRFACQLVVSETSQSNFVSTNNALIALFDPYGPKRSLGLRIETDTFRHEWLAPAGACSFSFVDYTQIANGKVFTVTVNGVSVNFFAGSNFSVSTNNVATASSLANAINNSGAINTLVVATVVANVNGISAVLYIDPITQACASIATTTDASVSGAFADNKGITGFNAVPSLRKAGSKTDTALSRRYDLDISMDLPASVSGRNGRIESRIQVLQTDAKRKTLNVSGVYTALGNNTALEQYNASVDAFAGSIQIALGGTWEGPFSNGPLFSFDDEYATSVGKAGRVLRFSHTYEQLIYNQSKGALDDVRLRRQVLKVRPSTEAPGDYGPNGRAVYRLRRVTITYSASVDMTQTQDLKGVYETVVKPFLVDEAKLAVGSSQIALTFQEPELDRAENRISASVEVLAASNGSLVASTVTTQDEDEQGKYLVAVWNGDRLAKIEYDGPQTLRRTVTQRYTVIGPPSGAAAAGGSKDQFGVFNINQPQGFAITIQESSDVEAALDNFFGIPGSSRGGRGGLNSDQGFAASGGVPEPAGARAIYRNGVVVVEPMILGRPGDPQITLTKITKTKVYEYIHDPSRPKGGPGKDITQAFNGSKNDGPGGDLKTVAR